MKSRLLALNSTLATRPFAEGAIVTAFLLALLIFNLLTATLYTITTDDEVLFSDPGVNLYQGHGFTSSAWSGQDKSALWSGNLPLYSLALSQWLRVTTFGLPQVRAFSYTLAALAAFTFWLALLRLGWLRTPLARLLFVTTAFLSYPLFNAYRVARYDSLQILLTSLILLAWSHRPGTLRQLLLFLLGFLIATSGFQAVAYIGLLTLILLTWQLPWQTSQTSQTPSQTPSPLWRSALPFLGILLGLLAGIIAILTFYHTHGIMSGFTATIHWAKEFDGHTLHDILKTKFQRLILGPLTDPGILPMMLILLLVLTQRSLCVWDRATERLALLGLLCSYIIVIGIELAVHYATYYHWMNQLLLVAFVCAVLERAHASLTPWRKAAILFLRAAAILLAAPKNVFLAWCRDEGGQYTLYRKFLDDNLRPHDVVFLDYLGYFPAKERNLQLYLPAYLNVLTPEQEKSITVLLCKNLPNGGYYARFGNTYPDWFNRNSQPGTPTWTPITAMTPGHNSIRVWLSTHFPNYLRRLDAKTCGYQMTLYRKTDNP